MLMNADLVADITTYSPGVGEAAFWWIGQLGYVLKTVSATLCFDPYLTPAAGRLVAPLLRPDEMAFADFIFGSHDHSDHIDRPAWPGIASASPRTRFVTPLKVAGALSKELGVPRGRFVGMDEGAVYTDPALPGFRILGVAAAHEFLAPDPVTGLHDSMSYIVDIDGLRVYHSGDTCKYEGLETKLISNGPFDIMFLPINGRDAVRYKTGCIGNMSFAEAVDLAGAAAPRLAVPGHYEMFANNSEDPRKFTDYLAVKYPGRRAWVGEHGVRVCVNYA